MEEKTMTLRMKLILGFAAVLILLGVVAFVGNFAISGASTGFGEYRNMARDTNLTGRIQANMLLARMGVKNYIISSSEENVSDFNENFKDMVEFIEDAKTDIEDPERKEKILYIDDKQKEYKAAFEEVQIYQKEAEDLLFNVLGKEGRAMEVALTSIMTTAERDDDALAAYRAGLALRSLLLARLYVQKFWETINPADAERVLKEKNDMDEQLVILDNELQNPDRRAKLALVQKEKVLYFDSFDIIVKDMEMRQELIIEKLDKIGPDIAKKIEEVKLSIKNTQDDMGPKLVKANDDAQVYILIVSAIALVLGIGIVIFTTSSVQNQLGGDPSKIAMIARNIAEGNLALEFTYDKNKGPVGVYKDMETMTENLRSIFRDISGGIETLSTSSSDLSAVASQMTQGAQSTSIKANQVADASGTMSDSMQVVASAMEDSLRKVSMVATATEEMTSTIAEIARNSEQASTITSEAVVKAKDASEKVHELGKSADLIGQVVETITGISEQVNLLALNATIEAASAGEAGKGFAVVAHEIKTLAGDTASATQEIKDRVEDIQQSTSSTVERIGEITGVVSQVNEMVMSIATAVEEQTVTTKDIAANVSAAADGINEVNTNVAQSSQGATDIAKDITDVKTAAEDTNNSSGLVSSSSQQLAALAQQLSAIVQKFNLG